MESCILKYCLHSPFDLVKRNPQYVANIFFYIEIVKILNNLMEGHISFNRSYQIMK